MITLNIPTFHSLVVQMTTLSRLCTGINSKLIHQKYCTLFTIRAWPLKKILLITPIIALFSFINLSIYSFIYSCTNSFICILPHPFIRMLVRLLSCLQIHPFIRTLFRILIRTIFVCSFVS